MSGLSSSLLTERDSFASDGVGVGTKNPGSSLYNKYSSRVVQIDAFSRVESVAIPVNYGSSVTNMNISLVYDGSYIFGR